MKAHFAVKLKGITSPATRKNRTEGDATGS
jgi:hypothetical protein